MNSRIEKKYKKKNKKEILYNNKLITDFYRAMDNNISQKNGNLINIEDNSNDNNNQNNNNYIKMKKKEKNEVNDSEYISENKYNLYPLYFVNLNSNSSLREKRNLVIVEFINNNLNAFILNIEQKYFSDFKDFNKSFPFQNCKILNINNSSYIIGGLLNDEINNRNQLGLRNCYKLDYNIDNKEIKITKLASTIYEHQSHSLLYLKKYKTIVCCSGYQQNKCEYLNLGNNKEKRWNYLFPLTKSRTNAIPLLFNEKYIFLIGGNDYDGKINEDYDVLNYDIFINSNYGNHWKTYSLKDNTLLEQKGSGIIYYNNDIFIFGGYNIKNDFLVWKVDFELDKEDKNKNKSKFVKGTLLNNYKISSIKICDNIINSMKEKNDNSYCFCGDQVFMNYEEFFVNISFGGQIVVIENYILNN